MELAELNAALKTVSSIKASAVEVKDGVVFACNGSESLAVKTSFPVDFVASEKIIALLASLDSAEIKVGAAIRVQHKSGEMRFPKVDPSEIFRFSGFDPIETGTVDGEELKVAIRKVTALYGEHVPQTGIWFLEGVSSVSRVQVSTYKLACPQGFGVSLKVPALFTSHGMLNVSYGENLVRFYNDSFDFVTRRIQSQPNISKYAQFEQKLFYDVPREPMIDALKRVSMATEDAPTFEFGKTLRITSDLCEEEIECSGEEFKVKLNHNQILLVLSKMTSETVRFGLNPHLTLTDGNFRVISSGVA